MLGALPSSVRESLANSTKEMMKVRGVTLYKEGAKSNGIWLISNGVVKVLNSLIMKLNISLIIHTKQKIRLLRISFFFFFFLVGKQDDNNQTLFLSYFYTWEYIGSL